MTVAVFPQIAQRLRPVMSRPLAKSDPEGEAA